MALAIPVLAQPVFPIKNGKLQSDLNAGGYNITNLSGLYDTSGNPIVGGGGGGGTNGILYTNNSGRAGVIFGNFIGTNTLHLATTGELATANASIATKLGATNSTGYTNAFVAPILTTPTIGSVSKWKNLNGTGTNTLSIGGGTDDTDMVFTAPDGSIANIVADLHGTNLALGTVNSNRLDTTTLGWITSLTNTISAASIVGTVPSLNVATQTVSVLYATNMNVNGQPVVGSNTMMSLISAQGAANTNHADVLTLTVSNQNLKSFDSLKRDNYWLASTLGLPYRAGERQSVTLSNGLAHGLLYLPADGVARATNYLFVLHRTSVAPAYLTRFNADNLSDYVTVPFPSTNTFSGNAIAYLNGKVYAQAGIATVGAGFYIAEFDPVTLTSLVIVSNTASGSTLGGLTTDGTNLFYGVGSSAVGVHKYTTAGSLLGSTNTYLMPPSSPPYSGRSLHAGVFDGVHVWFSSFTPNSGVIRMNPATLGFDYIDFPTNGLTTNFYATDDICESQDHIWIPNENTNGIVVRVDKQTTNCIPIWTGAANSSCWASFFDGSHVWLAYPFSAGNTNVGMLVRLDPNTLHVDHYETDVYVNEIQSDGQRLFTTTFYVSADNTTNSVVRRNPLGTHVLSGQSTTNGTMAWSVNLLTGEYSANGGGITNLNPTNLVGTVPVARIPTLYLTNDQRTAALIGITGTPNPSNLVAHSSGSASHNTTFIYSNGAYRASGGASTSFYATNIGSVGAEHWVMYNFASVRYSNSTLEASSPWTAVSSSPGPITYLEESRQFNGTNTFHGYHTFRGTVIYSNGVEVTGAAVLRTGGSLESGVFTLQSGTAVTGSGDANITNMNQITASNLTLRATSTPQINFGATNAAPSDTATADRWIDVSVGGTTYRMPLYTP